MDNSGSQFYNPSPSAPKKSKTKVILFLLLLIIIAALAIFGTMRFLQARDKALESEPTPTADFNIPTEPVETDTPTPASTQSATVTPTEKVTPSVTKTSGSSVDSSTGLDRSKLTIEVQNGSGVAGAAGKMQTTLEDLGYVVSKTGNANNYDYSKTVIEVKATRKSYLPLLQKDLSTKYSIGSTSATMTDSSADAIVIVGKE